MPFDYVDYVSGGKSVDRQGSAASLGNKEKKKQKSIDLFAAVGLKDQMLHNACTPES